GGERLALLGVHVGEHQRGALLVGLERRGAADAARRSRDQYDLPIEDPHQATRLSLSGFLSIFPVDVLGSSSTTCQVDGTLNGASRSRQCCSISSSPAPSASTSTACTSSPRTSWGRPITAAPCTDACSSSTSSISRG